MIILKCHPHHHLSPRIQVRARRVPRRLNAPPLPLFSLTHRRADFHAALRSPPTSAARSCPAARAGACPTPASRPSRARATPPSSAASTRTRLPSPKAGSRIRSSSTPSSTPGPPLLLRSLQSHPARRAFAGLTAASKERRAARAFRLLRAADTIHPPTPSARGVARASSLSCSGLGSALGARAGGTRKRPSARRRPDQAPRSRAVPRENASRSRAARRAVRLQQRRHGPAAAAAPRPKLPPEAWPCCPDPGDVTAQGT
jgi:hypothetical protein